MPSCKAPTLRAWPCSAHVVMQIPRPELVRTDLLLGLHTRLAGCVDLLLFNPPYVVTPDDEVALGTSIAAAWAGGWKGRRVIDRLLPRLPDLLSPTGHLFMVTIAPNDPAGERGPALGGVMSPGKDRAASTSLPATRRCKVDALRRRRSTDPWPAPALIPTLADVISELNKLGFQADIALQRDADEERLFIVHAWRESVRV